jgi:hypothetical protein
MSKIHGIQSLRPRQSCRRTGSLKFGQGSDHIQSREITIIYRRCLAHARRIMHHDLAQDAGMRLLHAGPDNWHSRGFCVFFSWNRRRAEKRVILSLHMLNLMSGL